MASNNANKMEVTILGKKMRVFQEKPIVAPTLSYLTKDTVYEQILRIKDTLEASGRLQVSLVNSYYIPIYSFPPHDSDSDEPARWTDEARQLFSTNVLTLVPELRPPDLFLKVHIDKNYDKFLRELTNHRARPIYKFQALRITGGEKYLTPDRVSMLEDILNRQKILITVNFTDIRILSVNDGSDTTKPVGYIYKNRLMIEGLLTTMNHKPITMNLRQKIKDVIAECNRNPAKFGGIWEQREKAERDRSLPRGMISVDDNQVTKARSRSNSMSSVSENNDHVRRSREERKRSRDEFSPPRRFRDREDDQDKSDSRVQHLEYMNAKYSDVVKGKDPKEKAATLSTAVVKEASYNRELDPKWYVNQFAEDKFVIVKMDAPVEFHQHVLELVNYKKKLAYLQDLVSSRHYTEAAKIMIISSLIAAYLDKVHLAYRELPPRSHPALYRMLENPEQLKSNLELLDKNTRSFVILVKKPVYNLVPEFLTPEIVSKEFVDRVTTVDTTAPWWRIIENTSVQENIKAMKAATTFVGLKEACRNIFPEVLLHLDDSERFSEDNTGRFSDEETLDDVAGISETRNKIRHETLGVFEGDDEGYQEAVDAAGPSAPPMITDDEYDQLSNMLVSQMSHSYTDAKKKKPALPTIHDLVEAFLQPQRKMLQPKHLKNGAMKSSLTMDLKKYLKKQYANTQE